MQNRQCFTAVGELPKQTFWKSVTIYNSGSVQKTKNKTQSTTTTKKQENILSLAKETNTIVQHQLDFYDTI